MIDDSIMPPAVRLEKRKSPRDVEGFVAPKLVDLSGIEPLTSCMPCRRSPS
jgi:hypothetical protein